MSADILWPQQHDFTGKENNWPEKGNGSAEKDASDTDRGASGKTAAEHNVANTCPSCEIPPFMPDKAYTANGSLSGDGDAHVRAEAETLLSTVCLEDLAAECARRICPGCSVRQEAEDTRLRSLADLDNAKKRLAREREEQARFAAEAVLADIIPSLDNLDLALQHAGKHDVCKDFVTGVEMTQKLLYEALAKYGLERVGAAGEAFDPAVHEAVGTTEDSGLPDGHVCTLLSGGYKLRNRLLRPARVMVSKKC